MTEKYSGFKVDATVEKINNFHSDYCQGLILKGTFIGNSIKALEDLRDQELKDIIEMAAKYGYKLVHKND